MRQNNMNILMTGANGFIGRYLLASLMSAGHRVVPAVRRPSEIDRLLAKPCSIAVDFNRDIAPETWIPRLAGIDAVINCAGILQGRPGQSMTAIHAGAPKALFTACARTGVKRVIQISAISAEEAAGTAYAETKRTADNFLATLDLDWIILRPSLVYAEGAYGGTALFRALAALPRFIPMIGAGNFFFQPIHVDDLAATIHRVLDDRSITRKIIEPVGPERLTLREILLDLRRWLGAPPARVIEIPIGIVRIAARLGDFLGGSINTTALRQLLFGNVGSIEDFVAATGIRPRRWRDALLARPAQAQDRWHARLYFARPALRWSLALMWVASGLVGITQPQSVTAPLVANFGLSGLSAALAVWISCFIDIAIGALLILRYLPRALSVIQFALVAAYTIGLSVAEPSLWTDPFGPLLKNIPILAAIVIFSAVENDR
jgi:uncharacterized protein YbjT (DUF2867 family)